MSDSPAPTLPSTAERVDGRAARSQRTRDAVVEALLELHELGDIAPTAQRIADRAGVALRTVYGHFTDVENLYAVAAERQLARLAVVQHPIPEDLPLAERLERFCRRRAEVLEKLFPVMRASRLREPFSEQLQRNRARFVQASDVVVRSVFRSELEQMPSDAQEELVTQIYVVAGGPAWEALRTDRGLPAAEAAAVLRRTVSTLVEHAAAAGGQP